MSRLHRHRVPAAQQARRVLRTVGLEIPVRPAEPIRRRTLSQVDVLARHARIEDRDAFAELRKQVLRMNDAAWWIEHKNDAATTLAQDIEL